MQEAWLTQTPALVEAVLIACKEEEAEALAGSAALPPVRLGL